MKRVNFVLLLSFIWVRFGVQVGAGVRVMVRDRVEILKKGFLFTWFLECLILIA